MHPIERLRYVARADGAGPALLVRETALALCEMEFDPQSLILACRRIVERHPTMAQLWWLCANVLASPEPFARARELALVVERDETPGHLDDVLPDDAQVVIVGHTPSPADTGVLAATWATAKMFGPFGAPGDLDPRRNLPGAPALNLWHALPFYLGLAWAVRHSRRPAPAWSVRFVERPVQRSRGVGLVTRSRPFRP